MILNSILIPHRIIELRVTFFQSVDRHMHLYVILVEVRSRMPEKQLAKTEKVTTLVKTANIGV